MSPLFWVVLALAVFAAIWIVATIWALQHIRSRIVWVQPSTPTITSVPRKLAIPTAHRRKHSSRWS